jgi:hypothetical protein
VVVKITIFWDITPCCQLKAGSICYLLHADFLLGLFFYPEDGGDMLLRNVSLFSTDYTD